MGSNLAEGMDDLLPFFAYLCIGRVYSCLCDKLSLVQNSPGARVCSFRCPIKTSTVRRPTHKTLFGLPHLRNKYSFMMQLVLHSCCSSVYCFFWLFLSVFTSIALVHFQTSPRHIIKQPIFLTGMESSRNSD